MSESSQSVRIFGFLVDSLSKISKLATRTAAVTSEKSRVPKQQGMARWQSGYAADCKSVYLGSTPGRASIFSRILKDPAAEQVRPEYWQTILMARWQSGYAADCKSVYLGSTPGRASIFSRILKDPAAEQVEPEYWQTTLMARWQSGYAADCKSVYLGSTPGRASIF